MSNVTIPMNANTVEGINNEDSGGISLWRDAYHRLLKNKLAVAGGDIYPR